jgi:hypothetical protein
MGGTADRDFEEELSFVEDRRGKNNLLILDEYTHESYFDTLKITEYFFENENEDRYNEYALSLIRTGRRRRRRDSRPILFRFTSYSKKVEELKGTRNLAGKNIKIEQDYSVERRRALRAFHT